MTCKPLHEAARPATMPAHPSGCAQRRPLPDATRAGEGRRSTSGAGLIVDLFAGGGGASVGIEAALGRPVDLAVNHSQVAIAVHEANHAGTRHLTSDVFEVDPIQATRGHPVELLWASPDCTHFSRAKGSRPDRPRSKKIRALAWVVVRWARAVRPRLICLENVEEFKTWGPLDRSGQPIPERAGTTYAAWCAALRRLGYVVEARVLDASLYGAPTRRKRLFVVARCDGHPIEWPEPTHGPGLLPYRTAGECIDWSIPTRSIFGRKRPLAEKTMHRIAEGIRRFVLESPRPYIVRVNHGRDRHRGQPLHEPLTTVEASRRGHALVAPYLVNTRNGERAGQAPRVRGLDQPAPTVTAKGSQGALACAAFVAKHFGGVYGHKPDRPLDTVTARDHHSAVAASLIKFRGACTGGSLDEPMPTITAQGMHLAECRAFLRKYRGAPRKAGGTLFEELAPASPGVVRIEGVEFEIADIFLRMLEPEELLRAQFGEFADGYDLAAARTKEAKTRLVGNSVCPHVARALVEANVGACEAMEAAS